MSFGEKLKAARKAAGISQEALAERLGVSRQAVTKWETDRGNPDLENVRLLADLFGVTVDSLLEREGEAGLPARETAPAQLYESRTAYDIDGKKHFDLKLGTAASLLVRAVESEQIVVRLTSDRLADIARDFKVKIDDVRGRIDLEVREQGRRRMAAAKAHLSLEVLLPEAYLSHVELAAYCREVTFADLRCEHMEFAGQADRMTIQNVEGRLEVDSFRDMDLELTAFAGSLELNQISAASRLTVPRDFAFRSLVKGRGVAVSYEAAGEPAEDFSDPGAETVIEYNGIKSELVICRAADDPRA